MQVPQHAPVVISLGEDSSDEEGQTQTTQLAGPGLLSSSLDMFLKEARKTVEVTLWVRSSCHEI